MPKKESAERFTTSPAAIPFDLDRHYTPQQIMKILNKSHTTVYEYLRKQKLGSYQIGREYIITASQLNEFAKEREIKAIKNMLVSGAMVEIPFAGLTDADLSTAILFPSAIAQLYHHDPKVFAGLRDWLDIQDLPQVKFPLPDLE